MAAISLVGRVEGNAAVVAARSPRLGLLTPSTGVKTSRYRFGKGAPSRHNGDLWLSPTVRVARQMKASGSSPLSCSYASSTWKSRTLRAVPVINAARRDGIERDPLGALNVRPRSAAMPAARSPAWMLGQLLAKRETANGAAQAGAKGATRMPVAADGTVSRPRHQKTHSRPP